jgi:hypothetical protein
MNRLWGFDRNNKGLKLVLAIRSHQTCLSSYFRAVFVKRQTFLEDRAVRSQAGLERATVASTLQKEEDRSYCLYSEDEKEAFTKTSTDFKVYFCADLVHTSSRLRHQGRLLRSITKALSRKV